MRTTIPWLMLIGLISSACNSPPKECYAYLRGKALHFDEASDTSGLDCVCAGPESLACIGRACDGTDRGPWCVDLAADVPSAGDYALTATEIQDAMFFCTYDTGGDPLLEELASDPSLPPLDCAE